jgi:hypothetical protein
MLITTEELTFLMHARHLVICTHTLTILTIYSQTFNWAEKRKKQPPSLLEAFRCKYKTVMIISVAHTTAHSLIELNAVVTCWLQPGTAINTGGVDRFS